MVFHSEIFNYFNKDTPSKKAYSDQIPEILYLFIEKMALSHTEAVKHVDFKFTHLLFLKKRGRWVRNLIFCLGRIITDSKHLQM